MSTALQITKEEVEQFNYSRSRMDFSFDRMKRELGHDKAVQFERCYQGIDGLEQQSIQALAQINDILEALRKPAILRWPTEPLRQCDNCDAMVPATHIKGTGYFDSVNEFAVDGGSCCRKCRGMERFEDSDWTPVDEALGLPVFGSNDFFFIRMKRAADAVDLASDLPFCDVVDLTTGRPISTLEARCRLEDPKYGEFEKFGVSFPECLNLFLGDWLAGLYPGEAQ